MAIDKKLQIFDDEGNPVDYDILASDVKFNDGKDLPTKLDEMEDEIGEGGYTPPAGGIPKTDLASSVQQTLDDVANKVDKVPGKGLSTNDYTTEEKNKLGNLPTNPVQSISVNGTAQSKDTQGNVNIQVQTGSTISPADTAPQMDGTANVGSSAKYAREDHVHPHDTSKANASEVYTKTQTDTLLAGKQSKLTFDDAPTTGSNNPVKSGGVKQAIDNKLTQVVVNEISGAADIITIDDADLALIDEDGNIAMRVAEGHVETANFDSRQVATNTSAIQQLQSQIGQQGSVQTDVVVKEDVDAAFDITDESGKVAMRITSKGHIKTKCFDSENVDVFRQTNMGVANCVCHGYGSVSGTPNTLAYCISGYNAGFRVFEIDCIPCQDGKAVCGHSGRTVYKKGTSPIETTTIQAAAAANSAADVVANYSWDENGTIAISTLESIIAKMCFGYRCIVWLDWQIGQAMLAASTYAKSLGVEKYVFHYLNQFSFPSGDAWDSIPCNVIATAESVSAIQSAAASYKKADNNVILKVGSDKVSDNTFTDEQLKALPKAAHDAGCLMMSSVFTNNKAGAQRAILCGFDFVIASGASEYNVNTITNLNIFD